MTSVRRGLKRIIERVTQKRTFNCPCTVPIVVYVWTIETTFVYTLRSSNTIIDIYHIYFSITPRSFLSNVLHFYKVPFNIKPIHSSSRLVVTSRDNLNKERKTLKRVKYACKLFSENGSLFSSDVVVWIVPSNYSVFVVLMND